MPDCAVRRHGIVCAFDADNPHSLTPQCWREYCIRFGLQAFGTQRRVCHVRRYWRGYCFKVFAPRYAVIAAMVMGITVALIEG